MSALLRTIIVLATFSVAAAQEWVTPIPYEGVTASTPTPDAFDADYSAAAIPRFNFSAELDAVLQAYGIPGGVVALITLPTSHAAAVAASQLFTPSVSTCPFHLNALSAAGVRRVTDPASKVSVQDPFHHGSNTKAMTAMLLNRKVQAGVVSWTTPLRTIFPYLSFGGAPPSPLPSPFSSYFLRGPVGNDTVIHASWANVTLAHLLDHATGLPKSVTAWEDGMRYIESFTPEPDLYRLNASSAGMPYPIPSRQWFVSQALAYAIPQPPASTLTPSGQGFLYSNYNYMLAGVVVEELYGAAWEIVIHSELWDPLGMGSAGFGPPEIGVWNTTAPAARAWGHINVNPDPNGAPNLVPAGLQSPYVGNAVDNVEALGPAGTSHMNLVDWSRLTACHLLEGSLALGTMNSSFLSPATFHAAHSQYDWSGAADGGASIDYSVSGYIPIVAPLLFPAGWGDAFLAHDGTNTYWHSRSALYLHSPQPFAILAAFNLFSPDAMNELFAAVVVRYNRWREQQRITVAAAAAAASVCPTSTTPAAVVNAPLGPGLLTGTVGPNAVHFAPLNASLSTPMNVSSITFYPYYSSMPTTNSYTLTLGIYSKYGVLIAQTNPVVVSSADPVSPFVAPLTASVRLDSGSYYVGYYFNHTHGGAAGDTQLYFRGYRSPVWWYAVPTPYTNGDLKAVAVEQYFQYVAPPPVGYAPLFQLSGFAMDCAAAGPASSSAEPFTPPASSTAAAPVAPASSTAAAVVPASSTAAAAMPTSSTAAAAMSSTASTPVPASSSGASVQAASSTAAGGAAGSSTAASVNPVSSTAAGGGSESSSAGAVVHASSAELASTAGSVVAASSSSGSDAPLVPAGDYAFSASNVVRQHIAYTTILVIIGLHALLALFVYVRDRPRGGTSGGGGGGGYFSRHEHELDDSADSLDSPRPVSCCETFKSKVSQYHFWFGALIKAPKPDPDFTPTARLATGCVSMILTLQIVSDQMTTSGGSSSGVVQALIAAAIAAFGSTLVFNFIFSLMRSAGCLRLKRRLFGSGVQFDADEQWRARTLIVGYVFAFGAVVACTVGILYDTIQLPKFAARTAGPWPTEDVHRAWLYECVFAIVVIDVLAVRFGLVLLATAWERCVTSKRAVRSGVKKPAETSGGRSGDRESGDGKSSGALTEVMLSVNSASEL